MDELEEGEKKRRSQRCHVPRGVHGGEVFDDDRHRTKKERKSKSQVISRSNASLVFTFNQLVKLPRFHNRDLFLTAKKMPNLASLTFNQQAPPQWQKPLPLLSKELQYNPNNRGATQQSPLPNAASTLQFPMPRLIRNQGDRTHPLVWFVAIILAILAVAVIITGIVVLVVYMVYKPKMPYIQVTYANLDKLEYDQSGLLDIQMTLTVLAVNDNVKADASFDDISLGLGFEGVKLAELRAHPFKVPMNNSFPLYYIVQSSTIPLDEGRMESMDAALKQTKVPFMLYGQARTRWKVGIFLSVKFWQHLSCKLEFNWPGGSSIGLDCSSNSD